MDVVIDIRILLGIVALFVLWHLLSRWWRRWKVSRRLKRGIKREGVGYRLLQSHGYTLLAQQESVEGKVAIDGAVHRYFVKPDALVTRGGKLFIAEIKTGGVAPDPLYSHTRRQLFEYIHLVGADGLLLVDADRYTIKQIAFQTVNNPVKKPYNRFVIFLIALALGVVYCMVLKS